MNALFGGRKTVDQQLRENKRAITRAVRELQTEQRRIEQDKTRIGTEIKKLAKKGEMDAAKVLAKQYVRNDNYIKRFITMQTNLQALELRIQTLKSTNAMAETMKQSTAVMKRMNATMKLPKIQQVLMNFEKESGLLESKEEMMNDAIDDALDEEGDLEETEGIVDKVLAELGIELSGEVAGLPSANDTIGGKAALDQSRGVAVPTGGEPVSKPSTSEDGDIDADDLEARLRRLKRN